MANGDSNPFANAFSEAVETAQDVGSDVADELRRAVEEGEQEENTQPEQGESETETEIQPRRTGNLTDSPFAPGASFDSGSDTTQTQQSQSDVPPYARRRTDASDSTSTNETPQNDAQSEAEQPDAEGATQPVDQQNQSQTQDQQPASQQRPGFGQNPYAASTNTGGRQTDATEETPTQPVDEQGFDPQETTLQPDRSGRLDDTPNEITAAEFAYGTGQFDRSDGITPIQKRELAEDLLAQTDAYGVDDIVFDRRDGQAVATISQEAQRERLTEKILDQVEGPINPRNLQFEETEQGIRAEYTPRFAVGEEAEGQPPAENVQLDVGAIAQNFDADQAIDVAQTVGQGFAIGSAVSQRAGAIEQGKERAAEQFSDELGEDVTVYPRNVVLEDGQFQLSEDMQQTLRAGPDLDAVTRDIETGDGTATDPVIGLDPRDGAGTGAIQGTQFQAPGTVGFNQGAQSIADIGVGAADQFRGGVVTPVADITGDVADISTSTPGKFFDESGDLQLPTIEDFEPEAQDLLSAPGDETQGPTFSEGAVQSGTRGVGSLLTGALEFPSTVETATRASFGAGQFTGQNIQEEGVVEGSIESGEAGVEAGEEFAGQISQSVQEDPGFFAGSLAGSVALTGGASAISSTAGRGTAYLIQPGEELVGAGLTRAAPGIASRFPGGRIDIEEGALLAGQRGLQGARNVASRLPDVDRSDLSAASRRIASGRTPISPDADIPSPSSPFSTELVFDENFGPIGEANLETDTAASAGARRLFRTFGDASDRIRSIDRPRLTEREIVFGEGGDVTTRRRLNIDRPDVNTPDISGRIGDFTNDLRLRTQRIRYSRPDRTEIGKVPGRTTVFTAEGEADAAIQEIGVQAESESESDLDVPEGEFEAEDGETNTVDVEQGEGEQRTLLRQEQETTTETEVDTTIDTTRTGTGFEFDTRFEAANPPQADDTVGFDPLEDTFSDVGQPQVPTDVDLPTADFEFTDLPRFDLGRDMQTTQLDLTTPEAIGTPEFGQDIYAETGIEGSQETTTETTTETEQEIEAVLEGRGESKPREGFPFPDLEGGPGGPSGPLFGGDVARYEFDFLDPLSGE